MTSTNATLLNGSIGSRVSVPQKRGSTWLRRMLAAIAAHQKASRDYELLLDMSDHQLEDIGLDRHTIRKERARLHRQLWAWSL